MKATLTVFAAAAPRASTRAAAVEARAAAVSATTPRSSAPRVQRPVMSLTLRGRGWAPEPETRFRCRFYASAGRKSRGREDAELAGPQNRVLPRRCPELLQD